MCIPATVGGTLLFTDSAMRLPPAAGSRRACHTPFFFFLLILLSHIQ